jgi:hypothetical protein
LLTFDSFLSEISLVNNKFCFLKLSPVTHNHGYLTAFDWLQFWYLEMSCQKSSQWITNNQIIKESGYLWLKFVFKMNKDKNIFISHIAQKLILVSLFWLG